MRDAGNEIAKIAKESLNKGSQEDLLRTLEKKVDELKRSLAIIATTYVKKQELGEVVTDCVQKPQRYIATPHKPIMLQTSNSLSVYLLLVLTFLF